MSLRLVRHGETDLNAARVVQFPDTPLGAHGLAQSDQLGRALADQAIATVITSDYRRAQMTAEKIAEHTGANLIAEATLRERNYGDVRGRPHDELAHLDIFGTSYEPPNGESWSVFNKRVDRAWQKISEYCEEIQGDIVIVTHGLVLRSLFARVLDSSAYAISEDLIVANTSVTRVERDPPWRIVELASTEHLQDDAREGGAV
ncbi:MAG: histidine phosphatase family protein [Pseudomonadota bacterium]